MYKKIFNSIMSMDLIEYNLYLHQNDKQNFLLSPF